MKGRAAVFTEVGKPLEFQEFPIGPLEKGALWVKVKMSTICGSDLLMYQGKKPQPRPSILGHEIIGTIEKLGEGVTHDSANVPVKVGDRITWTIFSACGKCYYCTIRGIPQKCTHLSKYGHDACDMPPHFNGGFAEYCYITPGTFFFKIPDELTDKEVTPANCTLATAVQGADDIGIEYGDNVLVIGGGALGCYSAAVVKERGASKVIIADLLDSRLEMVKEFGADISINTSGMSNEEIVSKVKEYTSGIGVDVVIDATTSPAVIPLGLDCLRKGGRFLEMGNTHSDSEFSYNAFKIISNLITIKGNHNYSALALWRALQFLVNTKKKYPFEKMVGAEYTFDEINEALKAAESRKYVRVAIVP